METGLGNVEGEKLIKTMSILQGQIPQRSGAVLQQSLAQGAAAFSQFGSNASRIASAGAALSNEQGKIAIQSMFNEIARNEAIETRRKAEQLKGIERTGQMYKDLWEMGFAEEQFSNPSGREILRDKSARDLAALRESEAMKRTQLIQQGYQNRENARIQAEATRAEAKEAAENEAINAYQSNPSPATESHLIKTLGASAAAPFLPKKSGRSGKSEDPFEQAPEGGGLTPKEKAELDYYEANEKLLEPSEQEALFILRRKRDHFKRIRSNPSGQAAKGSEGRGPLNPYEMID